jgi:hypothetical protein
MIEVGILKNFNSGTYKAGVQLAGSLTTYFDDISVARNIPAAAMVAGNYVILAIPGGNPKDACIIAAWPQGSAGGGGADISCRVYHSVAQTIPDTTLVFSAFDTELWDTDGIHDPQTNNSRLTGRTAGKYVIAGGGQFVYNATGRRHAQIRLNGATVIASQHLPACTDGVTSLAVTTIWDMEEGDYVELGFFQASGGDLDLTGGYVYSPWFAMAKIA